MISISPKKWYLLVSAHILFDLPDHFLVKLHHGTFENEINELLCLVNIWEGSEEVVL